MAIDATCSGCGKQFRLKEDLAGKRVRCNACGATFEVPFPILSLVDEPSGPIPRDQPLSAARSTAHAPLAPPPGVLTDDHGQRGSETPLWLIAGGVGAGALLVLVVVLLVTRGSKSVIPPHDAPEWSPSPALAEQLEQEVAFGDFTLRMPAGMVQVEDMTMPGQFGPATRRWKWSRQAGAAPVPPTVVAGVMDGTFTAKNSPEEILAQSLPGYLQALGATDTKTQNLERGQFDGRLFVRLHFTCLVNRRYHRGLVMLTLEERRAVVLAAVAAVEAQFAISAEFRLLEAALLTFRER